jgi:tyrosyl-tRNA synthetase
LFHELSELKVERPEKFGGNISYSSFAQLESDFGAGKLHPMDLKGMVAENLVKIIAPIRDKLQMDDDTRDAIKNSV